MIHNSGAIMLLKSIMRSPSTPKSGLKWVTSLTLGPMYVIPSELWYINLKPAHVTHVVPVFVGSALELRQTVQISSRAFSFKNRDRTYSLYVKGKWPFGLKSA
jgi:hypothetical protein